MHQPIVIVTSCAQPVGEHPSYTVQMKYIEAVLAGAGCMPLVLPALGERVDWEAVLATADGVLLTGSPSNVHPVHFGQQLLDPTLPLDPARDATSLPLITALLERAIPLLAICRGAQEINVALGGSLHQAVHQLPGMLDHRDSAAAPLDQQYGPAHAVTVQVGGHMARILDGAAEIMVNSLHGQGIDRLADGLRAEALAGDGLIEAFSVERADAFALALQWHPEWQFQDNPQSRKLFGAFGAACRHYQSQKRGVAPAPA